MNRRNFLKLPMAGAVMLPASVVASKLAVPERELQVVEAWAAPVTEADPRMELIAEFPQRIVSLVAHNGRIYCATECAVYVVDTEQNAVHKLRA